LLYDDLKAGQRAAGGRPRPAAPTAPFRRPATVPALVLHCAINLCHQEGGVDEAEPLDT
jgi:hypothetical protein